MYAGTVEEALGRGPADRGEALLRLPEGQWFERKSARVKPWKVADVLVGFANAEGGVLVVGLVDGRVEGIDTVSPKHLAALQQAAMDFTQPAVRCKTRLVECHNAEGQSDRLLVFTVEPSEQVHTDNRDQAFLRVGDETRRLTFAQRQDLAYDKGQASYEATPVLGAGRGDLIEEQLADYAAAVAHPDPMRLLTARNLLTADGEPTVAAVLLFGSNPQRWLPEAYVRVLRYQGVERGTGTRQRLVGDVVVEGPIPEQIAAARQAVSEFLPARRALVGGRFEPVPLLPEGAWLEGLVNAVVHRSYSISGDHIRVEIFDDRIEIESPGRFPGLVDPSQPRDITRFARNPRITRVCADLRFGQELGEGIRRIFEEMELSGLSEPRYSQTAGSVRLVLSSRPADRDLRGRLGSGAREVLRCIDEAGRLSTGDVMSATSQSRPSALRHLRALQAEGLIEWIGQSPKDPQAYWTRRIA